ncbi:hypothetical protein MIR68_008756 [Amoeboaphelidium protococcarum]|nr:hypothetical protein MIR68_008756 [Amoeboaphelidium protococcarum]
MMNFKVVLVAFVGLFSVAEAGVFGISTPNTATQGDNLFLSWRYQEQDGASDTIQFQIVSGPAENIDVVGQLCEDQEIFVSDLQVSCTFPFIEPKSEYAIRSVQQVNGQNLYAYSGRFAVSAGSTTSTSTSTSSDASSSSSSSSSSSETVTTSTSEASETVSDASITTTPYFTSVIMTTSIMSDSTKVKTVMTTGTTVTPTTSVNATAEGNDVNSSSSSINALLSITFVALSSAWMLLL